MATQPAPTLEVPSWMRGLIFDCVVSKVDISEVRNAVDQAMKEIGQRYDFKGSVSKIELKDDAQLVLTADDGLPPKPAPDLFLEAARRLGVEPALCQVFEDADAGLEAARRAGMLATDVRPFGGGYREPG